MVNPPRSNTHTLYLLWESKIWNIYDESNVPNLDDIPSANYHEYVISPEKATKIFDMRDKYNKNKKKYNPEKISRKNLFPSLEDLCRKN